jgi:NADH:quinone reductase (non-electrogenic)
LPLAIGGGMGTGRHLVTALAMGADAVLLGSRMLSATEIWAHPRYKERILAANEFDNRVVMKIFRRHHRVLDNEGARAVADLETRSIADFEVYRPLVAGRVTRRAYEQRFIPGHDRPRSRGRVRTRDQAGRGSLRSTH